HHERRGLHAGVLGFGDQRPARDVRLEVPQHPAADDESDALRRLERLEHRGRGGVGPRHPSRHELLLLAGRVGAGSAGPVHRLGGPVVSAKQMLAWLDGRNGSSFGEVRWSANALSFSIAVGAGARNLRALLPFHSAVGPLAGLTRAGSPVPYTTETIKGIAYAI